MKIPWIYRFEMNYSNLTVKEKKVADYLVSHAESASNLTLRACANKVGVGQQTIVRCIEKCGYLSWSSFQKEAYVKADRLSLIEEEKLRAKSIPSLVAEQSITTISKLVKKLNLEDFQTVIGLIKKAKIIDIYGVERSAAMASELAGKLLHLGLPCRCNADLFYQKIGAEHLTGKDLCIAISQSGKTQEVIDVVSIAKSNGCCAVGITADEHSKLAEIVDFVFIAPTITLKGENEWISSRIAQMAFIDMLYYAVLQSDPKRFLQNLDRSKTEYMKY